MAPTLAPSLTSAAHPISARSLERLLQPSPQHPRRLHLAGLVRRIAWRLTGSEFESLLIQFELVQKVYGTKCLERMHLRHPAFVRFLGGNPYPRLTVTYRPSQREADWAYGPFPSRAAAERYAEEMLKLFLLRRCTFELAPDPSYPGCVYSEMKMCLAPCYKGCTDERYAEESVAVESFLSTRGESRLVALRAQRDHASANLEFESAAALHAQAQRVEAVRALAAELVRPLSRLRAVILQASANPGEVAVFLFENGRLRGPAAFSTLGMRIQNENTTSTSLFAQPLAIEPIPEEQRTEKQGTGIRDQGSEEQGTRDQGNEGEKTGLDASEEVLKGHDGAPGARVGWLSRAESGPIDDGALAPEGNIAPAKTPSRRSRIPPRSRPRRALRVRNTALGHPPPGPSRSAQALVLPPRSSPHGRNLLPRRRRALAHQGDPPRHRPCGSREVEVFHFSAASTATNPRSR